MLLSRNAVYSGKGTPMISKQGIATITSYSCYKQGLTREEINKAGMKPPIDQEQINRIQAKRDVFRNVQSKIKEKINMGTSQAVMEIRDQIRKDKE